MEKPPSSIGSEGVLLKLSGEVFTETSVCKGIISQITTVSPVSRLAVLVGGGNHIRGAQSGISGEARVFADRMGMIGTLLNALWLESMLRDAGVKVVHMSSVPLDWIRRYDPVRARDEFKVGQIMVLSGGTGLPYFSTDTSAVLRAVEIGAKRVLKGTKVKGVYADDPRKNPEAEFFPKLTYADALARNLAIMDQTAFSLAREYDLLIQVFNAFHPENIARIINGERVGTIVQRGVDK